MENNKKSRVKINAFDIFLVLLVLCLIGTLVFRIYKGITEDKNSYNNEYVLTFACDGEYDSIVNYIKEGDAVYLRNGELLGYIGIPEGKEAPIEIITSEQTEEPAAAGDGSVRNLKFVQFTGVIKMNGNAKKAAKGNYYVIGDENIIEGAIFTVHTKTAEFAVSVVSIEPINNY